jgi:hypothetical protein
MILTHIVYAFWNISSEMQVPFHHFSWLFNRIRASKRARQMAAGSFWGKVGIIPRTFRLPSRNDTGQHNDSRASSGNLRALFRCPEPDWSPDSIFPVTCCFIRLCKTQSQINRRPRSWPRCCGLHRRVAVRFSPGEPERRVHSDGHKGMSQLERPHADTGLRGARYPHDLGGATGAKLDTADVD